MKRFFKYYETIFSAAMAANCLIEAISANESQLSVTANAILSVGFAAIAIGFYFMERDKE